MASARETILFNARLVLPDTVVDGGRLAVQGTAISAVDDGGPGHVDLEGDLLLPGLVELHTDNLEKHLMPRPGVFWPSFSALCAHDAQVATSGITTVFDAVALGERDGREERLDYLDDAMTVVSAQRAADSLRADHFIHLRCEIPKPDVVDLFERYVGYQGVKLVSLMDHTPGDRQFADLERLREYALTHFGETRDAFDERLRYEKGLQAAHAVPNRSRIARACAERGIMVASHDDASERHIEEALELGLSISEFPTTEIAAQAARTGGMATIMGAPNVIRGGSASGNVAAARLAELDLLDALSSDYVPLSLISAPFRIVESCGWSLPKAVALVTQNPARMAGLTDRGALVPGLRADFVRVRLGADGPVVRETWRSGRRVA
ncbi:MAG: alpha-D-ribose 1-methylphosphonate 5-triphosphate diphosphatase [Alphaproteobacteria bacterium]